MADGYNVAATRVRDEVHAPQRQAAVALPGARSSLSPNPEPVLANRDVSELDLAAYDKCEFTTSMQNKIMKRCFDAFDVTQKGSLERDDMDKLFQFLGLPAEHEDLFAKLFEDSNSVDFDKFWIWWVAYNKEQQHHATESFSLVSAHFDVPFQQRQLLVEEHGEKFTPGYRVTFKFRNVETTKEVQISPWHDIPLEVHDMVRTAPAEIHSNRFNFLCEIPKWTRAKFEIATGEPYNPIKQDMKNGVPRFYKHGDMMWNYGAFPQTWESTDVTFVGGVKGDNDPIDAIEIGMTQLNTGGVAQVKILGVLGMIDDGEMDWKVICIAHSDPIAKFLDDIDDVPKFLPGCLGAIREWLRTYKICQGGVENHFAYDGEYKNRDFALQIVHESHLMWANLKKVQKKTQV